MSVLMLRYLLQLGNTDLLQWFGSYFEFFIPLLSSVAPWVLAILWEEYRFIELFVFDYDSLSYLFSLFL